MEKRSSEEDFTQAMLDLLKKLVSPEEFFLLTNRSVHELITLDERELMSAIRRREGITMLKAWSDDVNMFRADWLSSPKSSQATFGGRAVKVVTESATKDAKRKCAERKQRGSQSATKLQKTRDSAGRKKSRHAARKA